MERNYSFNLQRLCLNTLSLTIDKCSLALTLVSSSTQGSESCSILNKMVLVSVNVCNLWAFIVTVALGSICLKPKHSIQKLSSI